MDGDLDGCVYQHRRVVIVATGAPRGRRKPEPVDRVLEARRDLGLEACGRLLASGAELLDLIVVDQADHVEAVEVGARCLVALDRVPPEDPLGPEVTLRSRK